jgi:transcriptional regulator with XRE-family HTH domain
MDRRTSTYKKKLKNFSLESEMKRLNLTQSELARLLGIKRQVVHLWIKRGSINAHRRFRLELAGLGFQIDYSRPDREEE